MNLKRLLIGIAFTISGSANAATVFAPTDADINILLTVALDLGLTV